MDARADVLLRERPRVLVAVGSGPVGVDPDDVEVQGVHVLRRCEQAARLRRGRLHRRRRRRSVGGGSPRAPRFDRAGRARARRGRPRDSPCNPRPRCRRRSRARGASAGASGARPQAHRCRSSRRLPRPRPRSWSRRARTRSRPRSSRPSGRGTRTRSRGQRPRPPGIPSARIGIELGGRAREMHRHDGLRPGRHGRSNRVGVDVQVGVEHVDEDGRCAGMDDDVRGRRPGDRRDDDLVTRADAEPDERQVQRGGAGGERDRVPGADVVGEALLELGGTRAAGQPAAPEGLHDGLDLLRPDRRRLEREEGGAPGRTRCGLEPLHGQSQSVCGPRRGPPG